MHIRTIFRTILLSLSACIASGAAYVNASGNPDVVGILASITEPSNAAELGLTQDQLDKLEALIKQHESQALTFASEIRRLPSAERRTKATENIRMIERQGFALLNETQQTKAELWRRQKLGPASLIEPEVATLMGVSEEQIAKMKNVLEGRSTLLREMGRPKGEAEINNRLVAVLDESQKTIWQTMVGKPPQNEATAEAVSPEKDPIPSASDIAVRPAPVMTGPADGLVINFNTAPWKDVLKWLAKEAELSMQDNNYPQGTFTYQDKYHRYSIAEAMDVMNGVLLGKGYTLVKKQRVLISVDLGSGENAEVIKKYIQDLAELVAPEDLKDRGTFEILKCVFKPERSTVEEIEKEVKSLVGPTGSVVSFPTIGQVLVCETGGKLRIIRDLISGGSGSKKIERISLNHVSADEVLLIARPLLGLKDAINISDDLSISTDTFGNTIFATGSNDKLQKLKQIASEIDIKPSESSTKTLTIEPAFLKSHRLLGSDADTTWDILQSTFAGQTNMKLSRDPKTNNILAEATKADHEKIDNIIKELAGQNSDFEVIQLTRLDTQAAILTLEKFYGKQKAATDATAIKGPIFYGDAASKRIMVKGTKEEVDQIKKLLTTVEASSPEVESLLDGVLLLPYRGKGAERMLDSIELLMDAKKSKSKFRLILPASKKKEDIQNIEDPAQKVQKDGRSARDAGQINPFSKFVVAQEEPTVPAKPVAAPLEPQSKNDVVIRQGPNGLIVTSDNKESLQEFNKYYKMAKEQMTNTPAEPAVIVLEHIRATAAAELIKEIIAGEAATGGGGSGGGGLLGEVASSVLGGGGLFSGLFGGGGGSSSASAAVTGAAATGHVVITADPRLNALWVQANGSDMQMVEDLVTLIDIADSGVENKTRGTPETIFINFVAVEEIETIVKQVFADRIAQPAAAGGAQRQPSPQEFLAMIGGGGGRRGGGGGGAQQKELKEQTMTISADKKNNALIVVAPPMLFQDVKKLVTQIDQASEDDESDVIVMTMPAEVNPTTMQNALKSAFGASVKTSTPSSTTTGAGAGNTGNPADALQQFRNRGGATGTPGGFGAGGFGAGGFGAGGFGQGVGGFGGQGGQRGGGGQGGGGFGGQGGGGQRGGGGQGGGQRGGGGQGGARGGR